MELHHSATIIIAGLRPLFLYAALLPCDYAGFPKRAQTVAAAGFSALLAESLTVAQTNLTMQPGTLDCLP